MKLKMKNVVRALWLFLSVQYSRMYCIYDFLRYCTYDYIALTRRIMIFNNQRQYLRLSKHMSIQPFKMGAIWPEIWRLMRVPTMFDACTYCILLCKHQGSAVVTEASLTNLKWKTIQSDKNGIRYKIWCSR